MPRRRAWPTAQNRFCPLHFAAAVALALFLLVPETRQRLFLKSQPYRCYSTLPRVVSCNSPSVLSCLRGLRRTSNQWAFQTCHTALPTHGPEPSPAGHLRAHPYELSFRIHPVGLLTALVPF